MILFAQAYCLVLSSVLILLSRDCLYIYWLLMEVNLCCICFLIFKKCYHEGTVNLNLGLYYFIIQRLARAVFLVRTSRQGYTAHLFLAISIGIKLGIWPFYFWYFNFGIQVDSTTLFIALTYQKLPFLLLIFYIVHQAILILFFLVNMGIGVVSLLKSEGIVFALLSSSIYMVIWMFLFYCSWDIFLLGFFLMYGVCVYLLCRFKTLEFWSTFELLLTCSAVFLLRLPPFSLFFLKYKVLETLCYFFTLSLIRFVIFFTFLSLVGYSKMFFFFFLENFKNYQENNYLPHYSGLVTMVGVVSVFVFII